MGVPQFFAWLAQKYPDIVDVVREPPVRKINNRVLPIDTSQANPLGVEFDNLYLDMNGIIHPCTHPEDRAPPANETEMMEAIFAYMDRLFALVRPRKLLMLAVDGVAPRAKMNQQRSRRFRAAQESIEHKEQIEARVLELERKGYDLTVYRSRQRTKSSFDPNCITPGTGFMQRLSEALRHYIVDRFADDPGWREIMVVYSDASVPGEGEHKIMDFIRRQRHGGNYNPNLRHVLYGADADFIMLGLATHEPAIYVLREEFRNPPKRPCSICFHRGHNSMSCPGPREEPDPNLYGHSVPPPNTPRLLLVDLPRLRFHLRRDLHSGRKDQQQVPVQQLDRLIDDWIFLCCFVGNDFLPHLPSLEIREGAIDTLVNLYKRVRPELGGFINNSGFLDLSRLRVLLHALGRLEDTVCVKSMRLGSGDQQAANRKHRALAARGIQDHQLSASKQFASQADNYLDRVILPHNPTEDEESEPQRGSVPSDTEQDVADTLDVAQTESAPPAPSDQPLQERVALVEEDTNDAGVAMVDQEKKKKTKKKKKKKKTVADTPQPEAAMPQPDATPQPPQAGARLLPVTNTEGSGSQSLQLPQTATTGKRPAGARAELPLPTSKLPHQQAATSPAPMSAFAKRLLALNAGAAAIASRAVTSAEKGVGLPPPKARVGSPPTAAERPALEEGQKGNAMAKEPFDFAEQAETSHQAKLERKRAAKVLSNPRLLDTSSPNDDAFVLPRDALELEDAAMVSPDQGVDGGSLKERYYQAKFHQPSDDSGFLKAIAENYIQGLAWVMQYYFQGCPDWEFYYQYHYAPFASDFSFAGDVSVTFEANTTSVRPLEQLMSVFPAASSHLIPPAWAALMQPPAEVSDDEGSEPPEGSVHEFYPSDFLTDLNGKRHAWQGVSLLPFVDKARLHAALAKVYGTLTDEERERNTFGVDLLFVRSTHALAEHAAALSAGGKEKQQATQRLQALPLGQGSGLPMDGEVSLPPTKLSIVPGDTITANGLPDVTSTCLALALNIACLGPGLTESQQRFKAARLTGAVSPPPFHLGTGSRGRPHERQGGRGSGRGHGHQANRGGPQPPRGRGGPFQRGRGTAQKQGTALARSLGLAVGWTPSAKKAKI